ncbi:MAG TPA: biotin carboxylase [Actinobacteria bacterium]|nr:biotin carboxylase [Actinomycetota bacterium]
MFESLLVANRGEIARRIIATANGMGIRTIAVYSEADADLPFVREADEAVLLGPAAPAQSYLDVDAVLAAAKQTGAQAVHPGYGFLSENADFAEAVTAAGLTWVGPSPDAMRSMGDKIAARNRMAAAGVPVAPGTPDPVPDAQAALAAAHEIGYPVMVKAAAGGGGIGMSAAFNDEELTAAYETARTRAERFFSDPAILLEKYVPSARHIEVQILGLADGTVVALGERDCSVQRRHQKVAEESPSPAVTPEIRAAIMDAAVKAGEAVGYRNAGTVEMLFDTATGDAWFLEMNTRLQVEHPVTEAVTGLDLVAEQLRIAAGEAPSFDAANVPTASGHAIELRIYAEDPKRFLPGPGAITEWVEPTGDGVRVDAGYESGNTVTPFYDPLLAKLIVHGSNRQEALAMARAAVEGFTIVGPKNNLPFFTELLANDEFVRGDYDTGLISRMRG